MPLRSQRDRADLCEAALMVEMRGEGLVIVDSVKVTMRSSLSTAHLWMARHCAAYTSEYEKQHKAERSAFHIHQRAYVMSAVTEAVAFAEALINEFFTDIHGSHADRYDSLGPEVLATIQSYWSIAATATASQYSQNTRWPCFCAVSLHTIRVPNPANL